MIPAGDDAEPMRCGATPAAQRRGGDGARSGAYD
jgi:hypothetical protein